MNQKIYDFIIVGAGAAGCVLAARLTEDPDTSVLLIEAGPDYGANPAAWPEDLLNPEFYREWTHSWGYFNAEQPDGRRLHLPRGKVAGGSSSVNACVWLRGSRADYDHWETLGNPGWGFDNLLPYFKKAESDPVNGTGLHGSAGPVPVYRKPDAAMTPVERSLTETVLEFDYPYVLDMNGTENQAPGVGSCPKNIADGMRMNGVFTYLSMARQRPNFEIISATEVDVIKFDGRRATGVRSVDGTVFHGGEVLLAGGAYGSPAILLRSGIGPSEHLSSLGIPVRLDLPGVGEGLMDHPSAKGVNTPWIIMPDYRPDAVTFADVLIKSRSSQVTDEIDLHLYGGQFFDKDLKSWVFRFAPSLQYSRAKGYVRLTSRDPAAPLEIDHCYFSEPADLQALCDGVEYCEEMMQSPPLVTMFSGPMPDHPYVWTTRQELGEHVKRRVGTSFHPSSTCKMGPDSDQMAVVDQAGKIKGLQGLRVVDASIFPYSPRCNLHFPVIAIAEKLADLIRQ